MLSLLGYKVKEQWEMLEMTNGDSEIIFYETAQKYRAIKYHRKETGLNHLAFAVSSKEEVDQFVSEFLKVRNITTLYGSPKAFPQYTKGYYAVYFEDPDRIKIEVVYDPRLSEKFKWRNL